MKTGLRRPDRGKHGLQPAARHGNRGLLELTDSNRIKVMDKVEIQKLQDYLRRLYGNAAIRVTPRPKLKDSAEVFVGEEFVGIISLDIEDGDRSYAFVQSILDIDLEDNHDD
jgi:hypothetical protein